MWPAPCAVCGAWQRGTVCADCLSDLAPPLSRCPCCALVQQNLAPEHAGISGVDECIAALCYVWPWSRLVGRMKYGQHLELLPWMRQQLHQALRERWPPLSLLERQRMHQRLGRCQPTQGSPSHARTPQVIIPMPMSPARWQQRGFNPALLLCQGLPRLWGAPLQANWLLRPHQGLAQMKLSHADRARNIQGAFKVEGAAGDRLQGLHVLLVDDVLTTGATAAEAARCLRQHGVRRVSLASLARTPSAAQ